MYLENLRWNTWYES